MTQTDLDQPLASRSTLFTNAQLVGRPAGSYSVLVEDGVVRSVTEGPAPTAQSGVDVVDLEQKWLSPSLIDWHTHFTMNSLASRRLDLYNATSAAEVLAAVRKAVDDPRYDEGGRFVAVNVRTGEWTDAADLNREALDAISSSKPIVLIHNGYHSGVLNTAALEFAGHSTADVPDGMLVEGPAFAVWIKLQAVADNGIVDRWVYEEAAGAAALGVTEIVDMEMAHNIPSWQRRCAKGFDKLRVHIAFYTPQLDDPIKAGLKTGDAVPGTHGLIVTGPFKAITDGSLGSQTAFCHDCYPNTTNRGLFVYEEEELYGLITKATQNGLRLAIHAIGDDANRKCLRVIKRSADAGDVPLPGSTIEHAQLVHFEDLATFARLGLIASIQPRHLVDDRELCHAFWPGREGRAYAFKSIVDAGIEIKLGSDCPVSVLNPWEQIASAITRAGVGQKAFCAEQIIDLETAYAASTQNGLTHVVEGDRADLVVLASNPLASNADELRKMQVEGTMLGGNWTFRRE